jgi:hypothetical protein
MRSSSWTSKTPCHQCTVATQGVQALLLRQVVHREADPSLEGTMTAREATASRRSNSLQAAEATKRFISPHTDKATNNSQDHEAGTTPREAEATATCEKSSMTTAMPGTLSTQDSKSVVRDSATATIVTASHHSLRGSPNMSIRENSSRSASPSMTASRTTMAALLLNGHRSFGRLQHHQGHLLPHDFRTSTDHLAQKPQGRFHRLLGGPEVGLR